MKKYIECDNCHKHIYLEQKCYTDGVHCGVYCSIKCFIEGVATIEEHKVDNDLIENCQCEIHEETEEIIDYIENKEEKNDSM